MPVESFAIVTSTIIDRIKQGLVASGLWGGGMSVPDVFPDPLTIENPPEGISFYLYHVRENARFKNVPAQGNDFPVVKLNPMALDLYYQMTASKPGLDNGTAAFEEQKMMSAALKALHDSPVLSVGDNKFRITLQPLPADEAVRNWTAGSSPLRLSAYYEVSPILLEPEPAALYTGRVLVVGSYVMTTGTPKITNSRSIIEFTSPLDTTVRQITASPGQATPGNNVIFSGHGFEDGEVQLRLFNFRFGENVVAPGWNLSVAPGELTVTVQPTANLERNGDPVDVLPGMYTAQILVTKTFELPGGGTKEIVLSSNQFPFIVMPSVTLVQLSGNILTITGTGFQVITDPAVEKELMEVYIGNRRLTRSDSSTGEDDGEFRVISDTNIEMKLPVNMETGQQPIRIIVAGAESNPAWQLI